MEELFYQTMLECYNNVNGLTAKEEVKKKTKAELLVIKKNKRTVFDYKILTKEISDDFLYLFEKYVNINKAENLSELSVISKEIYSPKGYFRFYKSSFEVINYYATEDRTHSYYNKCYTFSTFNDNFLIKSQGDIGSNQAMIARLKKLALYYLLTKKFIKKGVYDYNLQYVTMAHNTLKVKRERIASDLIKEVFYKQSSIFSDVEKLSAYTWDCEYKGFDYDEETQKIIYTYNGSEVSMRVGKGIKKMIRVLRLTELGDESLKRLANGLMLDLTDYEFEVITGKEIGDMYVRDNHDDDYGDLGSLASSCMRYEECNDNGFFEVYSDHAKMLVLRSKETGLYIGRAILWDAEDYDTEEEIKIMDRIYSAERTYSAFFKWAKDNGYWRKRYQSYDNETQFICPDTGEEETKKMIIKGACISNYSRAPYMDTFAWSNGSDLSNICDFGRYEARDTDGRYYGMDDEDWD